MTDERGGRYFREARFFLAGDTVAAQSHILEARSLMGYMRDQLALGGPPIQVQYATLQDGTQIKATMMNGQYQAQIVSPHPKAVISGGGYEVWVRPLWSPVAFTSSGPYAPEDYDWLVTPASGCSATAEHMTPRLYSNRMWQAPDKSIYCIVGGYDKSKYTGAAGSVISRDGEVVDTDSGIVGVGVFRGQLVKVTHALSTPNISGIDRDQVVYTVSVGGVVKLVTPTIDAYVDGGYGRGGSDYGFSQNIVVFNSDASEGSCVLGNAARLVFSLTVDVVGEVGVTHEVVAIPGADYTYVTVDGYVYTVQNTCTIVNSIKTVSITNIVDQSDAGTRYTIALACDYVLDDAGIEQVVYLLLDVVDVIFLRQSHEIYESGQGEIVCGFFGCEATNVVGSVYEHQHSYDGDCATLRFSTGEVVYKFVGSYYTANDSLQVQNRADSTSETHYGGGTISIVACDIKHKFIALTDNSRHYYTSATTVVDGLSGGGSGGDGTTTTVSTVYPDPVYPAVYPLCTMFIAGFAVAPQTLKLEYGDVPSTTTVATATSWDGFGMTNNCTGMYDNVPYTVEDSRTYADPVRTDSVARMANILLYEETVVPAQRSCGIVVPTDKDAWDSAIVFVCVPDAPAEVHSVCATGASSDVTSQFVDPALSDSEPTTKHFGIIRKQGK